MTEAEWLACTEPRVALSFLQGKVSDRKLRLFACACCRRIWNLLTDERSRHSVEVAERFADGQSNNEELIAAYYQANVASNASDPLDVFTYRASQLASIIAYPAVRHGADCTSLAADAVADTVADISINAVAYRDARRGELAAQCHVLHDIVGNPFRPASINPGWRDTGARAIAQAIYNQRDFSRLSVLADTLEDGGCNEASILDHCRGPGPHVRGCWVVDLLICKQ